MENKEYKATQEKLQNIILHAQRIAGLLPQNDEGFAYVIGQRAQVALDNLESALARVES